MLSVAFEARPGSVGLVRRQIFRLAATDLPFELECGRALPEIELAYESYGRPNADRSNAVLVLHALSGDAHAAGYHSPADRKPGWWDDMIGPGKAIDTDRFWVLCSNILGGCQGSTGPSSFDPRTGAPYGGAFPVITVADMVRAQERWITALGIQRLHAVVGASMGGFQAFEWSLRFPERVGAVIGIASAARTPAQAIAFNAVGRHAIMSDPAWRAGDYYGTPGPVAGLATARMLGHITYLSNATFEGRFGRRFQRAERPGFEFGPEFMVESYLDHQGKSFTRRFDANSYLYITRAMDYFDLEAAHGPLQEAFGRARARALIVGCASDTLFPPEESRRLHRALSEAGRASAYTELTSSYGHDAFLLEPEEMTRLMRDFLEI